MSRNFEFWRPQKCNEREKQLTNDIIISAKFPKHILCFTDASKFSSKLNALSTYLSHLTIRPPPTKFPLLTDSLLSLLAMGECVLHGE